PNFSVMRHIARKRFGQHFLVDKAILGDIVDAISPTQQDAMLEIGPGLGAMTLPLLAGLSHLTVVELDRDLAARLRHNPSLTVIEADVLNVDFVALAQTMPSLRIVGNLPYNISSPILFHLMTAAHLIRDQHFMLQKEVIDRMVAKPSTSDYSRLSVMLQWRYDMANVLFVPPESFDPPPRVDSAVVRMVPLAQPPEVNVKTLETLVQVAFSQRRKILRNTLGKWLEEKGFSGTFDLQRRAEEVPVAEFVALAQAV
ncbi:MAG: rRNA ((1518)-N(6)/adenine(1519)-N(6))-dimethyltransferase RsmA, partial [Pseudomonadota bacterium]